MRPVCESPKYCKDDAASVYLGQPDHLLRDNASVPTGFEAVRHHWKGRYSYAESTKGASALCQLRASSGEQWKWVKSAATRNPGFICAGGDFVSTSASRPTPGPAASHWKESALIAFLAAVRGIAHTVALVSHQGSDCCGSAHESAVRRRRCSVVRTS